MILLAAIALVLFVVSHAQSPSANPTIVPTVIPTKSPIVPTPTVVPTRIPTKSPVTPAPSKPPSVFNTNAFEHPPPCITNISQIAYINGEISATQTFYNCLANIADPMLIPTMYNSTVNGIMVVNTSMQLNNLHQIDAVAGTATLDFYLRLYWQDNRFSMPMFWKLMKPVIQKNGVELTLIMTNSSIGFWVPDIRFHDVSDLNYIVQTIRINSSNIFFWSRHTVATFMQPKFQFKAYPMDSQMIHIRYGSYAYSQAFLQVGYWGPALTYNQNYDGSFTFASNPLWTFNNGSTSYGTYVSSSNFLNAIYHISVTRQGSGIITRLIFPIALLLLLAGLTFWASYEGRVDSTVTILLAVSALYIVILNNIPLLGYLTAIDKFVFWMFFLLVLVVGLHQAFATINNKVEQWPLRIIYLRSIELIGRTLIFPCVIGYYLTSIESSAHDPTKLAMIVAVAVGTGLVLYRELFGFNKAMKLGLNGLRAKVNSEDTKTNQLSKFELFVFNMWMFHRPSTSPLLIAEWLHKNGGFASTERQSTDIRDLFAVRDTTVNRPTEGGIMLSTYSSSGQERASVLSPIQSGRSNSLDKAEDGVEAPSDRPTMSVPHVAMGRKISKRTQLLEKQARADSDDEEEEGRL